MALTHRRSPPATGRAVALSLLHEVLNHHRPLDDALEHHDAFAALEGRDRGFARLLVATVLRRLGDIDAAVAACLDKPLTPRARAAENILRLGAAQILFLGTPPHAAVAETVNLAQGPLRPYGGLINAVLRRLVREAPALQPGLEEGAERRNTPDWLWRSWIDAYGEPVAQAIARVHLVEPPTDLTAKANAAAWAARLDAELLATGSLRRHGATGIADLPGFAEGAWWVQDAAAALPARLLGDLRDRAILDLCAAPGGKTAQLAAAGARVTAVDRSAPRLARLAANLDRLGLSAETVAADATQWQPPAPADGVLLDAPCSATGTIRRHPDVARLKTPADVTRLQPAQDRLLDAAGSALVAGGTLVYCVCSLQPEEGPHRIAAFLARHPDFVRRPITADEVGGLDELVTEAGDLRTLPCHLASQGGMDGFYAARLVKGGG